MHIVLSFAEPGYTEHPYWGEMYRVIEIQKRSGVNRTRSDAKRREALEAYLKDNNMTLLQYERLVEDSQRPFHTDDNGRIIIPADKVLSCLVNADDVAPAKMRIRSLRSAIRATEFVTAKDKPDGVWERFAVVTLGSGNKASNQRGLRSNHYIKDFTAVGDLHVETSMVEPKAVVSLLEFAGRVVGIGASRKMGWGRFTVTATGPELAEKKSK